MPDLQRYYVKRYGPAVYVSTDEADLGGELLEVLAQPTVLAQAVEAGYVDVEAGDRGPDEAEAAP